MLVGIANNIITTVIQQLYHLNGNYHVQRLNSNFQFGQVGAIAKILNSNRYIVGQTLYDSLLLHDMVETVSIIDKKNQSFIIFSVKTYVLQNYINNFTVPIFISSVNLPATILVDYSSPNLAKEMHVGHLRSTIIGDSICKLLEYGGATVKRVNHVGDWGTQFGMLIAYIKQHNIILDDLSLDKLMDMYKHARVSFDTDINFKNASHIETVSLQQGNEENMNIWNIVKNISLCGFNHIYKQLNITNLEVKGESFYQPYMIDLMKDLDNVMKDSDGMKIMFAKNQSLPYILMKSDGGFTYDTSDLTAAKYRLQEEKVNHTKIDQVIYVVDSSQKQHFDALIQLTLDLGWAKENQLKYVGFGMVLGPDGKKIKTRSGQAAKLQSLLDDAYNYALNTTININNDKNKGDKNKNYKNINIEELSNKIAINCIKYADLSNPRLSDYKFNLDKMINVKGNTAMYLMYTMARCKSVVRNAPDSNDEQLILESQEATHLATVILNYHDTICLAITQLSPHYLCNYLYELAGTVTKYYEKHRCIDYDKHGNIIHIHQHHINMIKLVIKIFTKLFYLIGLEEVEQI